MTDPFIGEIRLFPYNFAPKLWAFCDGQLLPISQNQALYTVIETTYGGNGETTFALPDLRGRAPMHPEQGPGLSLHALGETGGSDTVSLLMSEIPAHNHPYQASSRLGIENLPAGQAMAQVDGVNQFAAANQLVAMDPAALTISGGGAPHNNMMPYLTLNFCIAILGYYPSSL